MNLEVNVERLLLAHKSLRAELLSECAPAGCWEGQVSSSPAATAAAVSALVVSHRKEAEDVLKQSANGGAVIEELVQCDLSELFVESLHWLARRQNEDGGWGDCDGARSNIAATILVQAAFRLTGIPATYADLMARADDFVEEQDGVAGLRRQYADNKAYLTSVLASCAAAGMISWRQVPTLPFEWLHLPKRWRREFSLPVARHLSPVVMAAGLAKLHNDPSRNPITRLTRRGLQNKTLTRLAAMQAGDDSYLASPLMTAFIVLSLASADRQEHAVVRRGIEFLLSSVRADASWSMTVNMSTRNTLLAIESLVDAKVPEISHGNTSLSIWHDTATEADTHVEDERHHLVAHSEDQSHLGGATHDVEDVLSRGIEWVLKTQRNSVSAVTESPAGGWASSGASGAESTTPATAGAVWLLSQVFSRDGSAKCERIERSAGAGIRWLIEMQNDDSGWGTYSHNDDAEPGVASGIDATAAALKALGAWQQHWKSESPSYTQAALRSMIEQIAPAIVQGLKFLAAKQNDDGSFAPLLFGNEHQANNANPVLGTAQVIAALGELGLLDSNTAERAASWMLAAQHTSGGWGPPRAPIDYSEGDRDVNSRSWRDNDTMAQYCSIEETAAAISALIPLAGKTPGFERAVSRGLTWLANAVEQDEHRGPAIIGFYLPQIWYYERLYPLVFAAGALSQSVGKLLPATPTVTSVS